jgi:hypothetical protein
MSHIPDVAIALSSVSADSATVVTVALVIDAQTNVSPSLADLRLTLQDCVPAGLVASLIRRYTPAELCFVLKPFLIRALLRRGFEQVHYVDGDICFYAPADPLISALEHSDVLLTPHYYRAPPDNGRSVHVLSLLRAGVFNGGYVAVNNKPEGRRFAAWWAIKSARYGRNDPPTGMCGDQRWLDLAPAIFPGAKILRHLGANAGYWNLHERPLTREGEIYLAGNDRLLFFHFSGFDPRHCARLSKFQTNFDVDEHPALKPLLFDYANRLLDQGYDKWRGVPYKFLRWWHSNHALICWLRNRYFRRIDRARISERQRAARSLTSF